MPVPLVGRDPDCVAGTYPLWGIAFLADEAVARGDLEQLAVLVLMPTVRPFGENTTVPTSTPSVLGKIGSNQTSPVAAVFSSDGKG
jgi:hypothetical protein